MTQSGVMDARAPRPEDVPLLQRRAAELARAAEKERTQDTLHVLIFALGGERYAIQSSCVLQVAVLRELTALPGAALPLFAVTHWRGDVLTLLDLRDVLGARTRGLTDLGRIVVVDGRDRRFGIVVDAVVDMTELAADAVRPLPDDEQRRHSLLRGMTDDGVLIIDTDVLLERFGVVRGRQTDTGRGG
jgi:purine-binding chemotaxis protein CheW